MLVGVLIGADHVVPQSQGIVGVPWSNEQIEPEAIQNIKEHGNCSWSTVFDLTDRCPGHAKGLGNVVLAQTQFNATLPNSTAERMKVITQDLPHQCTEIYTLSCELH